MKPTFRLNILSLGGIIFDEPVESVILTSFDGEFELLPFHYPLLAAIPEGEVRIAGHDPVLVKVGVVKFRDNECTIIAEAASGTVLKKPWSEI